MAHVQAKQQPQQAKSASLASAAQRRANRANAEKSTGPRTDEGKARASKNAITHGAFAAELLLPGENAAALRELRRGIYLSQSPQDVLERELVDRIVDAQWRLRRLRGAERAALVKSRGQLADEALGAGAAPLRATPARRALARAVADLRRHGMGDVLIEEEDEQAPRLLAPPPTAPGEALAKDFTEFGWGVVDRLTRYQQRLEQSVHRALRELRAMRKDREQRGQLPPCPYLAELDDADDAPGAEIAHGVDDESPAPMCRNLPSTPIVQNEPNSVATAAAPDAAEGCERPVDEDARRMAPIVIHPHPISFASPSRAGEGSD